MIDELIEGFEQAAKDMPEDQKEAMNALISELKALSGDGAKYIPACIATLLKQLQELNERYDHLSKACFIAPRDLQEGRVRIYDMEGEDQKWPRAVVQRPDPNIAAISYIDQESIDIFRSIKNDPLSIRHHAILLAIYRWHELVRHFHNMPTGGKKVKVKASRSGEAIQYERTVSSRSDIARIAETHLLNVGKTLLEGAKEKALPKEVALDLYIRNIAGLDTNHTCLRVAWQLLADEDIKKKRSSREKLAELERKLHSSRDKLPSHKIVLPKGYSGPEPDPMQRMIDPILQFLEEDEGKRFLTNRKSWLTIKAAFDDWALSFGKGTLRKYRSEARKRSKREKADGRWMYASLPMSSMLMFSKIIDWDSLLSWFNPPTIPADRDKGDV